MGLPFLVCCQGYSDTNMLQNCCSCRNCWRSTAAPQQQSFSVTSVAQRRTQVNSRACVSGPHILLLQLARFTADEAVPLPQRCASYEKASCIPAMTCACNHCKHVVHQLIPCTFAFAGSRVCEHSRHSSSSGTYFNTSVTSQRAYL